MEFGENVRWNNRALASKRLNGEIVSMKGPPLDYLDKKSLPSSNDLSKLVSFSMFVRMLIDGFEEEKSWFS